MLVGNQVWMTLTHVWCTFSGAFAFSIDYFMHHPRRHERKFLMLF